MNYIDYIGSGSPKVTQFLGFGDEIAHVLDQTEQRHLEAAQHVDRLFGIDQRQILGGGNDHHAIDNGRGNI